MNIALTILERYMENEVGIRFILYVNRLSKSKKYIDPSYLIPLCLSLKILFSLSSGCAVNGVYKKHNSSGIQRWGRWLPVAEVDKKT